MNRVPSCVDSTPDLSSKSFFCTSMQHLKTWHDSYNALGRKQLLLVEESKRCIPPLFLFHLTEMRFPRRILPFEILLGEANSKNVRTKNPATIVKLERYGLYLSSPKSPHLMSLAYWWCQRSARQCLNACELIRNLAALSSTTRRHVQFFRSFDSKQFAFFLLLRSLSDLKVDSRIKQHQPLYD